MITPNEHLLNINRAVDHMDERHGYVRLDRNERVTPWPETVFREMLSTLRPEQFCTYPDPLPLYQRLSCELGLPQDHIYLTNGSDAAIRMVFQTFVRPGDEIVFPDPTYAMYAIYSQIFRGVPTMVRYDNEARLDIDRMLQLVKTRPRLRAVASPDQPTGAVLSEAVLRQLAQAAHEAGTLLIVDEAYYPFYPCTAVPLVREFDNLVVTRTFSKIGGLAGLRLGYFVASPSIIQHVQRIRGAYEVNAMAIAVGSYVLDHPEIGQAHLREIERGREVLAVAARDLDLGFPSCMGNFQLLRFHGMTDTTPIVVALKQRGYLIKASFAAPCVRDCIRITLDGPAVMNRFVNALREVVVQAKQ